MTLAPSTNLDFDTELEGSFPEQRNTAKPTPIELSTYWNLLEFYNHAHDAQGRFASVVDLGNLNPEQKRSVTLAFKAIEKVHQIPLGTPNVRVWMGNSNIMGPNVDGAYTAYNTSIQLNEDKDNNSVTFVHEFGHHLSLGEQGNFSLNQFQDEIDRSNTLRSWRDAVQSSDTIQGLTERHQRTKDPYDEYLLDDREIFARSYAQWVVTRSKNKVLQEQFNNLDVNMKWSASEFEPIGKALDEHFKKEGTTQ